MKTKWKKFSTIPRSILSMNQNLSRQTDSDWDFFIRSVGTCPKLDLSKTERKWFFKRFLSENLSAFEGDVTIKQGLEKICPNDLSASTDWSTHFKAIHKKFSIKKGLIFPFPTDKQPTLLKFLQQEFTTASQQASLQVKNISRSQQMAEALCLLDYGEQEKIFKKRWKSGDRAQAFFVEVDVSDEARTVQKWIVKRLQRFAEGGEPPKYLAISIPKTWGEDAVDEFWQYLRRQLKLDDDVTVSEILEPLKQLCATKTVIIALYGVSILRSQMSQWLKQVWTQLGAIDRKSTRLNSSHPVSSRMPSSA